MKYRFHRTTLDELLALRRGFICRKRGYATKRDALRFAARMIGNRLPCDPNRLNAYWCERCGSYHIGHRSR